MGMDNDEISGLQVHCYEDEFVEANWNQTMKAEETFYSAHNDGICGSDAHKRLKI